MSRNVSLRLIVTTDEREQKDLFRLQGSDPLAVERPPADAEELGRAALVALHLRKDAADVVRFHVPEADAGRLAVRSPSPARAARDPELEVRRLDRVAGDERRGALEEVLELADVAGELVVEERLDGVARERERAAAVARADAREEVAREARDVLPPFAQRRHRDLDDPEA